MPDITLHPGDNRESLRRLIDQGVKVHAVCTDPPYGLVSVQKRFGKDGSAPARADNNDGSFSRLSGGFMGKSWDATGIERDPEFWALVWEILLPGGYCFAFGGCRTVHWQTVAMETAGFVIHPLHIWAFSQGFPKAHAADKAIDKMLGVKGEIVPSGDPVKRMIPRADQHKAGWEKNNGREYQPGQYIPGSPEAAQWEGWAYGTQTQKPALEPIVLAQKPFSEKTGAANLLKHGVGAVNVDGCRVPSQGGRARENEPSQETRYTARGATNFAATPGPRGGDPKGRHPANLIHDGSESVVALFPDSKGQLAKASTRTDTRKTQNVYGTMAHGSGGQEPRADSGSAARFFNAFPLTQEDIPNNVSPVFYNSKAGKADRAGSKHPTVKPIALLRHLIRHITPLGGVVLDPFAGSGTTAEAARQEGFDCILMEAEAEYVDFLRARFDLPGGEPSLSDLLGDDPTDHADPEVLALLG